MATQEEEWPGRPPPRLLIKDTVGLQCAWPEDYAVAAYIPSRREFRKGGGFQLRPCLCRHSKFPGKCWGF